MVLVNIIEASAACDFQSILEHAGTDMWLAGSLEKCLSKTESGNKTLVGAVVQRQNEALSVGRFHRLGHTQQSTRPSGVIAHMGKPLGGIFALANGRGIAASICERWSFGA